MDVLNNIACFLIIIALLCWLYALFNFDWGGKVPLGGFNLPVSGGGNSKKVNE